MRPVISISEVPSAPGHASFHSDWLDLLISRIWPRRDRARRPVPLATGAKRVAKTTRK